MLYMYVRHTCMYLIHHLFSLSPLEFLIYIHNVHVCVFSVVASQIMFLLVALVFGAAKSLIGFGQFTLPLSFEKPPISPIVTMHTFCSGGILALDVHPTNRYVSTSISTYSLLVCMYVHVIYVYMKQHMV